MTLSPGLMRSMNFDAVLPAEPSDWDIMSARSQKAHAEHLRARERKREGANTILALRTKLVANQAAYEERVGTLEEITPQTRKALREELELEALAEEIRDRELWLANADEMIWKRHKAYQASVRQDAEEAFQRIGAECDRIVDEVIACSPLKVGSLPDKLRLVTRLAIRFAGMAGITEHGRVPDRWCLHTLVGRIPPWDMPEKADTYSIFRWCMERRMTQINAQKNGSR